MDPKATLQTFLATTEPNERREFARYFNEWIDHGGFRPGIQLHPATDRWMMGDRFGVATKALRNGNVRVRMDRSGKVLSIRPENILEVL